MSFETRSTGAAHAASTLRIQVLGDAQVPAWAQDEAAFREWVACRSGRPKSAPLCFQELPDEAGAVAAFPAAWAMSNEKEHAFANVVAWTLDEANRFTFGWGGVRFVFFLDSCNRVRFEIDEWQVISGWTIADSSTHALGCSILLSVSGASPRPLQNTPDTFYVFDRASASFWFAPWSTDRLFCAGGVSYFSSHSAGMPVGSEWPFWVQSNHFDTAVRWIRHRLRQAARRFPLLRPVWAAARAAFSNKNFSLFWALDALNQDSRWAQNPLDWLSFSRFNGTFPSSTPIDRFARTPRPYQPTKRFCRFFLRDTTIEFWLGLNGFSPEIRRWARALPLAQARRLFQAVSSLSWKEIRSHPIAVAYVLRRAGRGVPSIERVKALLQSPFAMAALLLSIDEWGRTADVWPHPSYWMSDTDEELLPWQRLLAKLHADFRRNPVAFRARARAAQAWLEAPTRRKNLTAQESFRADSELLEQLESDALTPHVAWDRLGQKAPWSAYVNALRRARDRALLAEPLDMQEAIAAPETDLPVSADDAPWPSAIGLVCIDGVRVYPLCRPSHLAHVGDFFQNCMRDERLDDYTTAARVRGHRFFRLEHGDAQALLHLYRDKDEWTIEALLGRFNREVSGEIQAVGQRVLELYGLLEPAGGPNAAGVFAAAVRAAPSPSGAVGAAGSKPERVVCPETGGPSSSGASPTNTA